MDDQHRTETRIDGPLSPPPSEGQHLATVSYDGLLWDVYVEHSDDPARTDSFSGRLCFSPAGDSTGIGPVRTAAILIEPSYEEVFYRARAFEDHHLVSLLRSLLPEDGAIGGAKPTGPAGARAVQPDLPAAETKTPAADASDAEPQDG